MKFWTERSERNTFHNPNTFNPSVILDDMSNLQKLYFEYLRTAALDILDCIGMPDIILLKNERGDFQLSNSLKVAIIIFACVCFALSPVCLARYKMSCREIQEGEVTSTMNEVKQRKGCFIWHILIQIFCINLPFLILLLIVWFDHGYEASIFIAKTIRHVGYPRIHVIETDVS